MTMNIEQNLWCPVPTPVISWHLVGVFGAPLGPEGASWECCAKRPSPSFVWLWIVDTHGWFPFLFPTLLYSSFSSSSSSFLLPSLQARRRCVPHWPPLYSDARQHVKSHVRACQDKCQNTVNIIYQTRKKCVWLYGRVFGSINVNILYMAETMWWFYARYMPGCFSGYICQDTCQHMSEDISEFMSEFVSVYASECTWGLLSV